MKKWVKSEVEQFLINVFNSNYSKLILIAGSDNTKRRKLSISLNHDALGDNFYDNESLIRLSAYAQCIYDKKLRLFTEIVYCHGDIIKKPNGELKYKQIGYPISIFLPQTSTL